MGGLLLFLALQLYFFTPYYELNDDTFKTFFTQGLGTELAPSEFAGYSNPLWGLLIKSLFALFPHVPCYGIALVTIQALSFGALLWAFGLSPHPGFKALLFAVTFLGAGVHFFAQIQFTVTALLAVQSALFLLLSLWQNKRLAGSPAALGLSGFLLFAGSLIRFEAFLLAILAFLPLSAPLWPGKNKNFRETVSSRKGYFLALGLLVLGAAAFSHYWYAKTPGWSDFNRFDHERLDLMDYRIDPYNAATQPYFDQAGWTENDYQMFKDWYFMDKDIYDPDNMRRLAGHFPRVGAEGKPFAYHSLPETLASFWGQTFLMYVFAFFLWVPLKPLRLLALQFLWILALFAFLVYFWGARDRVTLPLLFMLVNAAIYFSNPALGENPGSGGRFRKLLLKAAAIFLAVLFLLGMNLYYYSYLGNRDLRIREKALETCLAEWKPREDHLYVVWDSSFPYEDLNVFDNFDAFRKLHIFPLAVYQRSPNAQKMLDRFGIKNLLRDLVDNPNVSLICWPQEGALYHQYMLEKYRMEITAEKTYDCPFFKVYRIHSKPSPKG